MKRGYLVTSAWDGRAQALQRALALFAILAVVASLLIVNAANPPSVLGAPGDNTTTFSVVLSGSATAGSSVNVTVTAKDSRGRTVNSYPGGAQLSGLADSPSGASATYVQPTAWQNGSASASVTPVKSQTGAVLTATDTGLGVSGNSAPFSVAPAGVDALAFANAANSFNGQPVDAEFDTPIASSLGNTFVPVKVIALDQFGNRKGGVSVTMSAPSQLDGTKVVTTNSSAAFGTSPYGEAAFSNISITEFGNYRLTASASGASSVQSNSFEIVADLAKCTGTSCKSTGRSAGANLQITYSSVTGAATLNNVVLTTSFIGAATSAGCNGAGASFGELTEARVQGSGISAAQPDFQMAVIVPKATLQVLGLTSRAVDTFNLCVGATRLDGGTLGWFGRETIDGPIVRLSADSDGIFWGWAATCGTAGLDADSPCISLKTKNAGQLQAELGLSNSEFRALGFKSSDLGIVLEKHFPWDARVGMR